MRLTLEALRTLEAIAEHGSFAAAAEVLHRVPSALTYTVQKLESDLDLRLFERSGRRAVLTPVGEVLVEQARDLLRQAESVEHHVRQLAKGWETRLTIAVDGLLPLPSLHPLIAAFDTLACSTQLRFTQEVFGGPWDALIDRRADLAVAAGEAPPGYGLASRPLAVARWVYACAPTHPLAAARTPIPMRELRRHRAVVVADSSRRLAARSSGVQSGQPTLTVPSVMAKIEAQAAGLGAGFVPAHLARPWIDDGRLRVCAVEGPREDAVLRVAWRAGEEGRARDWFRDALLEDAALRALFDAATPAAAAAPRQTAPKSRRSRPASRPT